MVGLLQFNLTKALSKAAFSETTPLGQKILAPSKVEHFSTPRKFSALGAGFLCQREIGPCTCPRIQWANIVRQNSQSININNGEAATQGFQSMRQL